MALLKRLTATLSARVDRLVGEIENHDAVAEVGIRDQRRAYAKAKVRLARMREEGERLRRRATEAAATAAAWRGRAIAAADEGQALECLRRHKRSALQAQGLAETLRQHIEVETRLTGELEAVRDRVLALEHRRHLLRSREAAADAAAQVRAAEGGAPLDLEDAFERWEASVVEAELDTVAPSDSDPIAEPFLVAEERAELRAELAAIRRDQAQDQRSGREDRHEA